MTDTLNIFDQAVEQYMTIGLRTDEMNVLKPYLDGGSKRILVAGMGAGRTSIALAEMGHHVVGFDFSPAMVEGAKKQAETRSIKVRHLLLDMKDMEKTFKSERFDLVFFPFHSLDYMPTKNRRREVLLGAFGLLKNNGTMIWNSHNRLFHRTFAYWCKTHEGDYAYLKSKEGNIRTYTVFVPSEKKWLLSFLPIVNIQSRYSLIPSRLDMPWKERIMRVISPVFDKSMYFSSKKPAQ